MLMSTRSKKRRPFKEIDEEEEEDKHSSQGKTARAAPRKDLAEEVKQSAS
jgi:hypothetical protein